MISPHQFTMIEDDNNSFKNSLLLLPLANVRGR